MDYSNGHPLGGGMMGLQIPLQTFQSGETSFYGEGGGQIDGTGVIKSGNGVEMEVENVQIYG